MFNRGVWDRACEWTAENTELDGEEFNNKAREVATELIAIDENADAKERSGAPPVCENLTRSW